jgi:hypothetical protein
MGIELHRPGGLPWVWGATAAEVEADYPCTGLIEGPAVASHRAIDVTADPATTFRWLCQLKQWSYSYSLLGGGGPRRLSPGLDELAVGQQLLVFRLTSYADGVHLTGTIQPELRGRYGEIACTYQVMRKDPGTSRIVVRTEIGTTGPARRLMATALAWADLLMMRKQLRTLKQLAEATAAGSRTGEPGQR